MSERAGFAGRSGRRWFAAAAALLLSALMSVLVLPGGAGAVFAAAPSAPTINTVTPGNGQVTVSWHEPSSDGGKPITGYTVTSNPGDKHCTAGGTTLQCTVTGLSNGTAYTFTVHATNADGDSPESAPSSPATPATVPGAPAGPITASPEDSSAQVSWAVPADDGGSPITGYTVTSSPGGKHCSTSGATSCTVPGLTNGTSYTFTVYATNAIGNGPPSAASNAVTPVAVPGPPTAVSATPGDGSAAVSWTAPASDGGSAITGYTVTSSPGGKHCSAAASPCTVTGLTNGTAYTFTVHATNAQGDGPESAPSSAVTPTGKPTAPLNVVATPGNTTATVDWDPPANDGGLPIISYEVTSNPDGKTCGATPPTTHCVVPGLTNGTSYTFTVVAHNSAGDSPASAPSNPATPATSFKPSAPSDLHATPGNGQMALSWTAPASDGGSPITSYTATAQPGGKTCTSSTPSPPATSCTITGLTNGTTYTFTVHATNGTGSSDESASVSAMAGILPGAPTGVTGAAGNAQVTVAWAAPANAGIPPLTSYRATASPGGAHCDAPSGTLTCVVSGLTNGTAYTFTVHASSGVGDGPESAASAAVIPQAPPVAPGAPGNVHAIALNKNAHVTWSPPADPGTAPLTFFVVTPSGGGSPVQVPAGVTQADVPGLTNGTSYTFTVIAHSSAGDSPASAPSDPVTPAPYFLDGNQKFAEALYVDFLNRLGTGGEVNFLATLAANGVPHQQIASGLANSPEWIGHVVTGFYYDTLGRAPDTDGLEFWSDQIKTGKQTVAQVAAQFYASNEYFDGFGKGNNTDWVTDLYSKLLHRAPDPGGLPFWVGLAQQQGRFAVAFPFFQSNESARDRVAVLYWALLHRAPESGGLDFWSPRVQAQGDIVLASFLAGSGEYYNQAGHRF